MNIPSISDEESSSESSYVSDDEEEEMNGSMLMSSLNVIASVRKLKNFDSSFDSENAYINIMSTLLPKASSNVQQNSPPSNISKDLQALLEDFFIGCNVSFDHLKLFSQRLAASHSSIQDLFREFFIKFYILLFTQNSPKLHVLAMLLKEFIAPHLKNVQMQDFEAFEDSGYFSTEFLQSFIPIYQ